MSLSVSLVISTYNWPEALLLCLKSVSKQTQLPAEIIIADDGSGYATQRAIDSMREAFPIPIHHVWQEDEGFRKALILNKALGRASSEYIIQIDGDVILDRNFIEDHLSEAEEGTFIRGTRAHVKKEVLPEVFAQQRVEFSVFEKGIKNKFNAIRFPSMAWLFTKKKNCSKSVRGSNIAFWKKDFVQVNGYSNDLQGWGHEDEELAARLVHSGILKKGLKFKAVQFHLMHSASPRSHYQLHRFSLTKTLAMRIKRCRNGYQEAKRLPQLSH